MSVSHSSGGLNGVRGVAWEEMEVVCEESEMPISVVKFAPQRSDLLAVGDEAGQVRIMQVEPETAIMQVRRAC